MVVATRRALELEEAGWVGQLQIDPLLDPVGDDEALVVTGRRGGLPGTRASRQRASEPVIVVDPVCREVAGDRVRGLPMRREGLGCGAAAGEEQADCEGGGRDG